MKDSRLYIPHPLMRQVCRLFGHKWQPILPRTPRHEPSVALVCLRCRENGWRI